MTKKIIRKNFDFVEPLKLYGYLRENGTNPFILESRDKHHSKARFTYISVNPEYIISIKNKTKIDNTTYSNNSNPFQSLKEIHNDLIINEGYGNIDNLDSKERFIGGFLGYFAYDCIHNYIGGKIEEPSIFGYYNNVFVFDHLYNRYYYLTYNTNVEELKSVEKIIENAKKYNNTINNKKYSEVVKCDASKEEHYKMVEKAKDYIYSGDAFQIVISKEFIVNSEYNPYEVYQNLREINPSPYMFLLEFKNKSLVGASPETMASIENNILQINPIAGSTKVGKTDEESKKLAEELLKDEKEKAEHMMLVDLARNDVRKVCKSGSVELQSFFKVIKYSHVQHIESEVIGELRNNCSCYDGIEAAFPAGTLTGAPKYRAMELIDEIEKSKRKCYGGAVGYFSLNNCADTAITIRTAEMEHNGTTRLRVGGGIVADSNPEMEYWETERKIAAVMKAFNIEREYR